MLKLTSTKNSWQPQQQPAIFSYQLYTDLEVYITHRYDLHFLVLVNLYASISSNNQCQYLIFVKYTHILAITLQHN